MLTLSRDERNKMEVYIDACAETIISSSINYVDGIKLLNLSDVKFDKKSINNAILEFFIGCAGSAGIGQSANRIKLVS